jgi:subtilisin-like proprotein convertase family protein
METSRFGTKAVWLGLVTAALLGTGCELITAPDRTKIAEGGAGGTGGEGGTAGMGGMGGTTLPPECEAASDCPAPASECLTATCTEGKCGEEPVAANTEVAAQTPGDCQSAVCDGNGAVTSIADDADLPVDGKECTDDVCTAGAPSNPPVAENTACGAGGALYCDGQGSCVGCTADAQCGAPTDCTTPTCTGNVCEDVFTAPGTPVPMQATGDCLVVQCDGIGGTKVVNDNVDIADDGNPCTADICLAGMATHPNLPSGAACSDGGIKCDGGGECVECLTGADCMSGVCIAQACAAPTCLDNVKNGTETDQDCGGPDCGPCPAGDACTVAGDCASEVCTGDLCQAPTCTDTVKNGTETDQDCGGSCPKCAPGLACNVNADCVGGSCMNNTCVPTCTDQVKNGAETDVDCGGTCATKCGPDKVCSVNADCLGGACVNNTCAASCTDLVKNGAETGVDCGGGTCAGCPAGGPCNADTDCALGGACVANVCVSQCPNGTVNAGEQCDDSNSANGDGCNSMCMCEATQAVTADPSPDVNIPDDDYDGTLASMACVNVTLNAQCTISSMTVTVGMAHTWIGDLTIKLVHPDNTVITLLNRPGEALPDDGDDGVTGGDSSNLVKTHPITFQTGAMVSAEDMGATITSTGNVCQNDMICTFAPAADGAAPGDLTALVGKPANGVWMLCAGDSVGFDTGSLDKVTLTVNQ